MAQSKKLETQSMIQKSTRKNLSSRIEKHSKDDLLDQIQSVANIGGWFLEKGQSKPVWTDQTFRIHELPVGIDLTENILTEFILDSYLDSFLTEFDKLMSLGKSFELDIEIITAKGNPKWVKYLGTPVYQDKKIVGARGTIQDITEKMNAELEMEQQRVKALHTAKLASIGEMAAGVAHEINNPLAIIDGYSRVIKKLIETGESEEAIGKLDRISHAVNRVSNIVKGLKLFARESASDRKEWVSFQSLVDDSLELCQQKILNRGIQLIIKCDQPLSILCKPIEFCQVLVNLLNNSSDAVSKNREKWIEIKAEFVQSEKVSIHITDSGQGIPETHQDKLFEPFFTTKDVGQGTGLGMSIAKGIIEAHGGTIYYNPEAKNTEFIIEMTGSLDQLEQAS